MKINITQVPADGLYLEKEINPSELDLETDLIKFRTPLELKVRFLRITNALTVDLNIKAILFSTCCRCLSEFEWEFNKYAQLNYPLETSDTLVDLSDAIREEVILDYPIKPLCQPDCLGLCAKCGKNKNEGGCNCGST